MSSLLIRNIKSLVQVDKGGRPEVFLRGAEMGELSRIDNAFLLIEDEHIQDFGPMSECPERADKEIVAAGRFVFPAWCDSHTHIVYAGSRESEFTDRIRGLSYEEIARRGGGILNSARRLRKTSEEELLEQARQRLHEVQRMGTGAIEIKSGYGLSLESELKMLRVIRQLKESSRALIKATFLGAHAMPKAYQNDRASYIKLITQEMLPRIAAEGLADYIDAFCEKGFFSLAETEQILEAGQRYGLKGKIHTNQFSISGAVGLAIAYQALSVDHLEVINEEEIEQLKNSHTIPTLLPSAPFFLNDHYPEARKMIDAGLGVALATDYNPGSTPSGRMSFVLSLACIKLRMTPAEAINAATLNGACAMEVEEGCGSIAKGKLASFFITRPMPSVEYLPYAFGSDLIETVFLRGQETETENEEKYL